MDVLEINTASRQYPVYIGSKVIDQLKGFLKEHYPAHTKILIITDENVGKLHLKRLQSVLSSLPAIQYIVPGGEKAKTFDVYYQVLSFALEQKLDRKSIILSFGGGAVGDLSGFVASSFMRGIPFIQIPTTILAHDSAVGGKVAINHPLGKNMIGAFYQPEAVFYDLDFISTLPLKEKMSGFAEVIKHSLISDPSFYDWILENISSIDDLAEEKLSISLKRGIRIKGSIVSEDEKEEGSRAFLNFGHTLGHAIEAEAGYGKISHGEGVIIGMLFALQLSKLKLGLSFDIHLFRNWLVSLGYEVRIPDSLSIEHLLNRMKSDKKSINQKVRFVLLEEIGCPKLVELEDQIVLSELQNFQ